MDGSGVPEEILETLQDLAAGRIQRSRHDLVLDGQDCTASFEAALEREGYRRVQIRNLEVPRAVRFPAFYLCGGVAHFGHVFREKFTDGEDRILFGSVVRDWRGDWSVLLTRRSTETIWVDLAHGTPFDEDRPSGGL